MPKFGYVVKDKEGKEFKNILDAAGEKTAIAKLQEQGYFIVSIKALEANVPQQKIKPKETSTSKPQKFNHKKTKLADLLTFSRQLATMLRAGVTLIRSLDVIYTQIQSEQLAKIIKEVRNNVEQGQSFSGSLAKYPKVFNQFWVSLIEVGEASGTIPTTLERLMLYLEQQSAFRSTVISGIIYPAILFCIATGAIFFFAFFVAPRFEQLFASMGKELPIFTKILLDTFTFIKADFLYIIGIVVAGIITFLKIIKTYHGRLAYEKFLFSFPAIGEVYRSIILERFFAQMSILLDSGVPILYALDIVERLVDNNTCALIVNQIKEDVKKGELLVTPMQKSGFFPAMSVQMVMVGEETGELSAMLKHIAHFYQDVVETFMKRFSTIIEPFMIIFIGAVIGTIVTAMFLPLFSLGA